MATLNSEPVIFSAKRSCAVIVIAGIVIFILVLEVLQPIKLSLANRYVNRGNSYFLSHNFERAEQEYSKALKYNSKHATALHRQAIADQAQVDMAAARSTFIELNDPESVAQIDQATQVFKSAPEALLAGVQLFQSAQYNLARYPLAQAVQLDPGYPEAWHYLYLTYAELGALNADFAKEEEAAKAQRDLLSPRWR